jgi:hypothetical protein
MIVVQPHRLLSANDELDDEVRHELHPIHGQRVNVGPVESVQDIDDISGATQDASATTSATPDASSDGGRVT